jgi:hypothetical protein
MPMLPARLLALSLAVPMVLACSSGSAPAQDGGSPVADGGSPVADGGPTPRDGGVPGDGGALPDAGIPCNQRALGQTTCGTLAVRCA